MVGQPHEATWWRSQGPRPGPGPRPHSACTQPPGCADGSAVSPGDKGAWAGPGPHIRRGQGREVNTDPTSPAVPPSAGLQEQEALPGPVLP